jgi:hypothetical protein
MAGLPSNLLAKNSARVSAPLASAAGSYRCAIAASGGSSVEVIRLAAALVPYAALARLIAVLAWLVAALNIVHLIGPTLDLLDGVAVVMGGLRVSILIVKGVHSLAMLLWAATLASNLFERQHRRGDPRPYRGRARDAEAARLADLNQPTIGDGAAQISTSRPISTTWPVGTPK